MAHLKDEQYYIDRYDRGTIELCRDHVQHSKKVKIPKAQLKDVPEEEREPYKDRMIALTAKMIAAERLLNKPEAIQQEMDADRDRDRTLNAAIAPSRVYCSNCESIMQPIDKDLYWGDDPKKKVLFTYKCPRCGKKKGIYNTGVEWQFSVKCTRCSASVEHTTEQVGEVMTTTYTCPVCNESWQDTFDFGKKPASEENDPNYETDRQRFCSSQELREFADSMKQFQLLAEMFKEDDKAKAKDSEGNAIPKVLQLKAAEVEAAIIKAIEPGGYTRLELGKPEFGREVVVDFSVQDARADREEYDSRKALKKLINTALEGTNWNLMSDGISYRMGFLSGRLKGRDRSEQ